MKTIKSLIAVLFLLVGSQAFAQTGTNPYVGAKHIYFVNATDATGASHNPLHNGNKYKWYVTTDLNGLSPATLTDYTVEEGTWNEGSDGIDGAAVANLFSIHITWNVVPSPANPYYIFVEEYSASNCISKRRIEVNVIDNAFDIILATAVASCNDVSNSLFTGDTPDAAQLSTSTRTFLVTMTGSSNSWKFNPDVSVDNGSIVSTTYKYDKDNDGSIYEEEITAVGGFVTVPAGEDKVEITVIVNNVWNSNNINILAKLDEGEDVLYGSKDVDEVDPTNYAATATSTVNPLPLTTVISTN